jgi:hypothetical protein
LHLCQIRRYLLGSNLFFLDARRAGTASISLVCGQLFSSLFFFDFHRTNFSDSAGPFTSFDPVGFAIFANLSTAGDITVESEVGRGSTFTIRLPIIVEVAKAVE